MNEEPVDSLIPGIEPVEEDEGPSSERKSIQAGKCSVAAPARSDTPDTNETPTSGLDPKEDPAEVDIKEEEKSVSGEPPVDWFEPLEDDDDADSRNDEESLAGESERSESMAGSEKASRKTFKFHVARRKRSHPDEGWIEWPELGDGWKRKEVVRRSGSSIGQKDVYYMGPRGDRVRSRVELVSVMVGFDLSTFDYKTGKFYEGVSQPIRVRNRVKRMMRERSSSESSWMERGEGADTPDSHHRLTPNLAPKTPQSNQTSVSSHSRAGTPTQVVHKEEPQEDRIRLPLPSSSSKPLRLPSINGEFGSEDSTLVCAKCGISFTGTWYDKQRKRPCCPSCWASKTKEHPMIRFRKWIPCGQCVGCHNTVNCGQCANCKHGLQSPETRRRICRKRRCICPIRKGPGIGGLQQQKLYHDTPDTFDDSYQSEVTESQHPSHKSSDTENFGANLDPDDDDDMSTDDDDDRHLLPFQMGQADFGPDGPMLPGRPRPHYTYSRKSTFKKNKLLPSATDLSDDDDDSNLQMNHSDFVPRNGLSDRVPHNSNHNSSELDQISRWERSHRSRDSQGHVDEDEDDDDDDDEEDFPMITQIFSLADNQVGSGTDAENQLLKLLQSLRSSAMPILWYAIMVEGPQLQLIQCSKQSSMTDTIVLIDPGFCYQITVQKQPLLPTHPLYDKYPGQLSTATEVVNLLIALEKYVLCQGLPPRELSFNKDPIIVERASTCDFLVKRRVTVCANCRALQGL